MCNTPGETWQRVYVTFGTGDAAGFGARGEVIDREALDAIVACVLPRQPWCFTVRRDLVAPDPGAFGGSIGSASGGGGFGAGEGMTARAGVVTMATVTTEAAGSPSSRPLPRIKSQSML